MGWGDVNVPWCCHIVDATQWMVWLGAKYGKMHANRTCTHGRWDGVGWMLAVLELATILQLARVHKEGLGNGDGITAVAKNRQKIRPGIPAQERHR